MVYSIGRSVSIYKDKNLRASALPNLKFNFGMTEFQKWLNIIGTCKKYRCFIVSVCVCDFYSQVVKNKTMSYEQASFCLYNEWIKIVQAN